MAEFSDLAASARDDDEGLFSRDLNGQLVRLDAPTEADYRENVTLRIDGREVTVPRAEPLEDPQGTVIVDIDGRTTPRYTTIYDAAIELYVKQPGDEAKIPIPILCHQAHMTPVAVCRLCVVQIFDPKRNRRERRLLPACQHRVEQGMEVFTMDHCDADGTPSADGRRVREAVSILAELLVADHLKPAPPPAPAEELAPFNELKQLADRCALCTPRFAPDRQMWSMPKDDAGAKPAPAHWPAGVAAAWPIDRSSPVFLVDHSACILCDRCARACGEVKHNEVIGRTGKGAATAVGFDLNDPMGNSTCVQCGECMVSCPTSAITFKPVAQVKLVRKERGRE